MPDLKPSAIEIYAAYAGAITKTRNELTNLEWFGGDWWINQMFGSAGFGFQLSKTRWFNHQSRGIHFEFWIEDGERKAGELPIVLHFEPDTPNRGELGKRFEAAFADHAGSFEDYRVNHKAICDKMSKTVKLTKSGLPGVVGAEFSRLAVLGTVIDDILQ